VRGLFIVALALCTAAGVGDAAADTLGFSTAETSKYLLIGTGTRVDFYGVDVDNRRIGGNIAITDPNGDIELSNVRVEGSIDTTQSALGDVTNGISNSTYTGINLSTNFNTLNGDLATAKTWIDGLSATQTRSADIKGNFTFELQAGLNVIDLGTLGSDFKIDGDGVGDETITIRKAAGVTGDVTAIFRVVNEKSFIVSQAIIDNQTGSHDNVMFYSGSEASSGSVQAFNLANMRTYAGNTIPTPGDVEGILNVSFWALGDNAEININNAIGCTQLVADKINLNNVDFDLCAFGPPPVVPLPAAAWAGMALMSIIGASRLRRARLGAG
jgi:hypothetical protein